MSDEECICPEPEPGIPAWLPTFADLMSLLMCFFVLLLSFSEMDVMKFKRLAGSMAESFGVQQKLKVMDIPKGTSIIAQEFSPGKPEPTPIHEIWQKTDAQTEQTLDVMCSDGDSNDSSSNEGDASQSKSDLVEELEKMIKDTESDAVDIANELKEQIARGEVEVETHGRSIIVRIKEKGAFASGSANLAKGFVKVLRRLEVVLAEKPGMIEVQGHTDNIPIRTSRFRSNWELSSARAVSVTHGLLVGGKLNAGRFSIAGFAETRPLVENKTTKDRARNRRVEIIIKQGFDDEMQGKINALKNTDPSLYKALDLNEAPRFTLQPHEVF